MRIEDNFLDTIYFDFLYNKLLDNNFPWYFQNSKVVDNDNENQFTHLFFDMGKQTSNHVNIIEPLLKRLEVNEVFKAKVNFTYKQNVIRPHLYHVDIDYAKGNTAILYMNTNNGKTLFENGKEVDSVANRLVVFGNTLKHTGTTHTNSKYRIVLNINYK
jgi:hypothetical protein